MNQSNSYHIPANFSEAGRIFGLFDLRNVIEAVVLAAPTLLLCMAIANITPFSITTKLMISLVLLVPVCGFALIGLRDESLFRFLTLYLRFRRGRRMLTYRGDYKA